MTFASYAHPGANYHGKWYKGDNMDELNNRVSNVALPDGDSGGTNWDDALHKAIDVANDKNDEDTTYIIFVSDGNPTYHMNENHTSRIGYGSSTSQDDLDAAYAEAAKIKEGQK